MRRLNDVVDGRGLAIARIGIGIAAIINLVEAKMKLGDVLANDTLRMPWWQRLPDLSVGVVEVVFATGITAAVAVLCGVFTRSGAALLCVLLGGLLAWEQQVYSNHLVLSGWCLLWLTLSRSDARWSFAARMRGPREVTFADQLPLMTQLCVVYLFTGSLKINDTFLSGRVIREWSHLDLPGWMWPAMAVAAVGTELSLAVCLWIPVLRRVAALAGLGLHLTIPFVMMAPAPLVSFSLLTLSLYPLFLVSYRPAAETRADLPNLVPLARA